MSGSRRVKMLSVAVLFLAVEVLVLILAFRSVSAARMDTGVETIATETTSWRDITTPGITQTLRINASSDSPSCDGQDLRVTYVKALVQWAPASPSCSAPKNLFARIETLTGKPLGADARLRFDPTSTEPQMAGGEIPGGALLDTRDTYAIRFMAKFARNQWGDELDQWYDPRTSTPDLSGPQPTANQNPTRTPAQQTASPTPTSCAGLTFGFLRLAHDDSDPYPRGSVLCPSRRRRDATPLRCSHKTESTHAVL